jgi:hypothetical protein
MLSLLLRFFGLLAHRVIRVHLGDLNLGLHLGVKSFELGIRQIVGHSHVSLHALTTEQVDQNQLRETRANPIHIERL